MKSEISDVVYWIPFPLSFKISSCFQDVYKLDTHDLANGMIRGEKVGHTLTAHDIFEVCLKSFKPICKILFFFNIRKAYSDYFNKTKFTSLLGRTGSIQCKGLLPLFDVDARSPQ